VVARVRGIIATRSRGHQISLTPGSVPPEAKQHVLVLAARQLIDSIPVMASAISANDNYPTLYTQAENWIKNIMEGGSVTSPDDPSPATVAGPDSNQNYLDLSLSS